VLDASQAAVLDLPADATAAVLGAPGSGKTATLIELVAHRLEQGLSPEELLVLTPTRAGATVLRDRIALRIGVPTLGPLARTPQSLAFEIVADAAAHAGAEPPRLLTGGEQDQMLSELLQGEIEDGVDGYWPDHLGPDVRRLRGFRTELRDLMMRCTEHGVTPAMLGRLGEREERPEWAAAATFLRGYDEVKASFRDRSFDSAELLSEATSLVSAAAAGIGPGDTGELGRFGRLRLILLDDAQESTRSTLALVRAFARRGVTVVAFGDPDVATGSFRGALPDAVARLGAHLGVPAVPTIELATVHRQGEELRALTAAVSGRIGTAGAGTQRRAAAADAEVVERDADAEVAERGDDAEVSEASEVPEVPDSAEGVSADAPAVVAYELPSPADELAVIARRLRERHVFDGMPWGRMAVLVRSGAQVPTLARGLATLEVPTRVSGGGTAVRDEYAVRAMILLVEVALGRLPLDASAAVTLLTGPLGGLDAVSLRRLKSALRHDELDAGGDRPADDLLVESLRTPAVLALIDTRVARLAARLAESIRAAGAQAAEGATIEELLWGVWQRSGLAGPWRERSLGSGIVAEEANRNLDAVVALFSAARRFVERTPDAPAGVFLDAWTGSDVPEDTLAPRSLVDAVTVSTPSSVIGEEFDTVIVAGVQDGVWPNLRIRGSLLGAQDLAAVAGGEADAGIDARTAVLHDELRMFAQAVSRATREVVVTAVANDDALPSAFFRLVPAGDPGDLARSPLSLRGIVARLRRELTATGSAAAARGLARLAEQGVPGADPASWYGLLPASTIDPLHDLTDPEADAVSVSPSRMESFETCPLHWFIDTMGGDTSSTATGLGTVLHKVMETATDTSADALWRDVEARWGEFRFEAPWQSEVEKIRAKEMTTRLSHYLGDFERAGGTLLSSEQRFRLPIQLETGEAVLSGSIDRVEQLADGSAVIVDLKTGSHVPTTDAAVADHPQLGAYQLAFAAGHIDGLPENLPAGGAKLVIVSKGTQKKPYYDPKQSAFTDEEIRSFQERVAATAEGMAGAVFVAQVGSHCLDPWSFGSCRIHVVKAVSA
jgi:superfamily I DNA/RNA helicase/RecB family exonuclease